MSLAKRGLGRGLDALFESNNTPPDKALVGDNKDIDIDLLIANPNQPRKYFNDKSLQELADSITSQGIIQPLLVRPAQESGKYEIIAGERRYRAAQLINLQKIPVYIRELTDMEVMAASLIENVQREDLNPIEEALALKKLRDEFLITQDELSQKIGKSRSAIANALRLLNLSKQAQEDLIEEKITVGHARSLLSIDDESAQENLHMAIIARQLTVRDSENAVRDWKNGLPFFWENEGLGEMPHELAQQKNVQNEMLNNAQVQSDSGKMNSNRQKTENIKELQKFLNEQLHFRANISGTEEKGKITLSYQNTAEFESLLQKLGI